MFWNRKTKNERDIDNIIEVLEIKKAMDVVKEYYPKSVFVRKKYHEFIFRESSHCPSVQNIIYLDSQFRYIKECAREGWELIEIIDLSQKNIKIQEEFKDLFEWMKLQQESFIKMKKFMKSSMVEMLEAQKK